jgi:hypothetical protein
MRVWVYREVRRREVRGEVVWRREGLVIVEMRDWRWYCGYGFLNAQSFFGVLGVAAASGRTTIGGHVMYRVSKPV